MTVEFTLNGKKCSYDGDPELPLLSWLRGEAGIISAKDGCSGQGACGCCSVHLEEGGKTRAILSCTTRMKKIHGCLVTTTEGIEKKVQEAFKRAFVKMGGIQCGFCTPGFVMQAAALLKRNLNPARAEVAQAINGNLCRCTGYKKIIDSILCAAASIRDGEEILFEKTDGRVGAPLPKYDCLETVLGLREFVCDMKAPDMLFGALRMSDHPRALVRSIDCSEAMRCGGVVRVVTAKDVPGQRVIGLIMQDWPLMVAEGEEARYVGDVLAGVIAGSEAAAREAAALIKVDYEILEPVACPFEAMKPGAPVVNPYNKDNRFGGGGNVLSHSEIKRGDLETARGASAFVAKGVYRTQCIEHAFMEPECCLAKPWTAPDGANGIEVFSQGQGVYEDRKQIAKILALAETAVKVVQVPNGGGFGGKEDLTVQGHAALYSFLTRQPVRVALTRDESILMHPKRHPMIMDYELGCDKSGKLTFLKADIVSDSGAYASVGMKVVERAAGHSASAYVVPVVHVSSTGVYTNNVPRGAMRGFGVNQAAFAMEGCVDELCEKGGFDRWQLRYDNAVRDGQMISTGQVIKGGAGVPAALQALKGEYYKAVGAGKAVGLAVGIKNTGIGNAMADIGRAKIVIKSTDCVEVHHGWTEMGQGVHTMAVHAFCEETGLDPSIVKVIVDTAEDVVCGMTTSSRGTSLVGHAVIDACRELNKDLEKKQLKALAGREYRGEWRCDWTTALGAENLPGNEKLEVATHYSYGYAAQLVVLDKDGKIECIYAAHDAGRIMNPTLFEGQIEGSVHMGLGYALTEEFKEEGCRPVTTKLGRMGIIRAKNMPDVVVRGVEVRDPNGPFGVKGVGEIGLVPTAPAVAGALWCFDKKRRYELPMREPERL